MKSLLLIFSLSFLSSVAIAGPIHNAAEAGNLQEVQRLIDKGVDVNSKNKKEETPLHYAAFNGYLEITRLLIENGADVNAHDSGWTPLNLASWHRHLEIAKLLLAKGAKVNARSSGFTPLHFASEEGDLRMVKLLIENGADINAKVGRVFFQFFGGITSLDIAKKKKHSAVIEYLISKGAE